MRLTNRANFDIYYCDEIGSLERPNGLSSEEIEARRWDDNNEWTKDMREEVAFMRQFVVDKPGWFLSAERSARRFVRGLGLHACRGLQVTLLDITEANDLKRLFPYDNETTSTDAQNSYYYGVVVRHDRAQLAYREKGIRAIGHRLVHELTHGAEWQSPTVLKIFDSEDQEWHQVSRQGQMLYLDDTIYGQFFSEGIAEFNAGLYTRRQDNRGCPLVSIIHDPSLQLPDHYVGHRPEKGVPYVVGPDGYSIEMLAWGVQERGITSTEDYINTAHATYSIEPETRLHGLRKFAALTNAIRPGLYRDLRNLEYGHQSWQDGLEMVHEAVTS